MDHDPKLVPIDNTGALTNHSSDWCEWLMLSYLLFAAAIGLELEPRAYTRASAIRSCDWLKALANGL